MAMIHHRGEQNPVYAAVDSTTVIEAGDLVYLATDDARNAGYDSNGDGTGDLWNTAIATTQLAFKEAFLGVALQRSRSGDTDEIGVATTGEFEFDCASASFEIGDYLAPAKTSGNNLEDQKVVKVTDPELAIARVCRRGTSVTKVWGRIVSTIMEGGVQADAGS